MNTSYAYNSYLSHDLNIFMRTSSGDEIKLDFANQQSSSISYQQDSNGSSSSMTFSSMQSFSFNINSNGIDTQDKKEIDAFMKIAQPYIDNFLSKLDQDAPKSPVNTIARQISDIFSPMKDKDENTKNLVKINIVDGFDKGIKKLNLSEADALTKIFKEAEKLLEKTLYEFSKLSKELYA